MKSKTQVLPATQAITTVAELVSRLNPVMSLPIAVPTVTVLAVKADDPFQVAVIKHQPTKHRGRMTLVGGKFKLRGKATPLQQAHTEWARRSRR